MCPLSYPLINEDLDENSKSLLSSGIFPENPIEARLIGTKILIFNNIHGYLLYGFGRYFGIPVGIRKPKIEPFERPLELSALEIFYLMNKNIVNLYSSEQNTLKKWTIEEFHTFAVENFARFEERYTIYEDLRDKNFIPRPGQKFGADFIVYRKGPGLDHSSFCIQVLSPRARISSIDVVRSARLATSVKKRFVMANPSTKSYFSFKWFKP